MLFTDLSDLQLVLNGLVDQLDYRTKKGVLSSLWANINSNPLLTLGVSTFKFNSSPYNGLKAYEAATSWATNFLSGDHCLFIDFQGKVTFRTMNLDLLGH